MRLLPLGLALTLCARLAAQEPQPARYIDPAQMDVPGPKHSFVKVPWRAFLETKSGDDFLRGVGVNYNVPGKSDLAVRLLAEAGFKTFRIETGWGASAGRRTDSTRRTGSAGCSRIAGPATSARPCS